MEPDNCHDSPRPECLSFLDSATVDDIFHVNTSDSKFYCLYDSWRGVYNDYEGDIERFNMENCPPTWDSLACWPYTAHNSRVYQDCPDMGKSLFLQGEKASKYCNLTGWTKSDYKPCLSEEMRMAVECQQDNYLIPDEIRSQNCLPSWLDDVCWALTPVGKTATSTCPPDLAQYISGGAVTRHCTADGWNSTDISSCLPKCSQTFSNGTYDLTHCSLEDQLALILRDIYFMGSVASLMLLTIALLIFCLFKSLQCPRVHIHKNLLVSLMLQCIIHIVIFEPYVMLDLYKDTLHKTYNEIPWLCKTLFTLSNFTYMTNIFWAFVEGLFLFSRISIAVFSTDTPYWLFYLIGWGIPAAFTVVWAICMHVYHKEQDCWRKFGEEESFWIIMAPIILAALANVIFLICIIKILVTKLHAVHSAEHVQIRKAMKATIVLLPLLSITSLFFLVVPNAQSSQLTYAYRITNACLQVSQGIFVSVLFCYFNGEVRSALMKYWNKWRTGAFKYRTSRASSVCVTQSETVFSKGSPLAMKKVDSHLLRVKSHHLVALGNNNNNTTSGSISNGRPSYISHSSVENSGPAVAV